MSDEDLLETARRALEGDAGQLLRLVARIARSERPEPEVSVELPPMNYTWRLPWQGSRGPGLWTQAQYEARGSWAPYPFLLTGLSLLSDIRVDEVPLGHEVELLYHREGGILSQGIPTRFLLREPRRSAPFLPSFIFPRPYWRLFTGQSLLLRFNNPREAEHRTEVYLHGMVGMVP